MLLLISLPVITWLPAYLPWRRAKLKHEALFYLQIARLSASKVAAPVLDKVFTEEIRGIISLPVHYEPLSSRDNFGQKTRDYSSNHFPKHSQ